jgi:hypothetical protein
MFQSYNPLKTTKKETLQTRHNFSHSFVLPVFSSLFWTCVPTVFVVRPTTLRSLKPIWALLRLLISTNTAKNCMRTFRVCKNCWRKITVYFIFVGILVFELSRKSWSMNCFCVVENLGFVIGNMVVVWVWGIVCIVVTGYAKWFYGFLKMNFRRIWIISESAH